MSLLRRVSITLFCALAGHAHAFTPAGGLWAIDNELNGSPGRGFQLEVENGTVLMTYYGYRDDGSSIFYLATGPMNGNEFVAPLTDYRGGTPLGSAYRPGTAIGSPGNVKIVFSSGKSGTLFLPNVAATAVSKFSFGYPQTPQGLLGTYAFGYWTGTNYFTDYKTLSRLLNASTPDGSGIVSNAGGTFVCEHLVRGILAGQILCTDSTNSQFDDRYAFKMAGDRGTGVGTWTANSSSYYPSIVVRTATQNGNGTGINDGTVTSLNQKSEPPSLLAKDLEAAAKLNNGVGAEVEVGSERRLALLNWAQEAQQQLHGR